jgi:uncharacterized protein YuzE
METVKILEKPASLSWDYDEEADVLYLSLGAPRPAVGVDIGEGIVLRYNEARREVVGLTFIGLRARLLRSLVGGHEATYSLHEEPSEYRSDDPFPDADA